MSTATTSASPSDSKPNFLQQLRANPKVPLIIAVAASVAILVALVLWTRSPDYRVLFSNISDRDGGEIIAQLDQMQVPYRFSADGHTLMVPAEQVDQTRLTLAGQGLPKGGNVGFELMDGQSFGISQFAEHVNYQRALEGELARSIESLGAVSSARVHLAIPKQSVFVREQKPPSASVVLTLYAGRVLDPSQVNAIVHLVSSSVSGLPTDKITVVDQSGNLLSNSGTDSALDLNDAQLKYTAQVQENYQKRIEAILAPLVGAHNVKAIVTADIDFSVGEHTQETYGPNQPPNEAAVRSQQISQSTNIGDNAIKGVPGALSNEPPGTAASPINALNDNGNDNNGNAANGANANTPNQAAGQGNNATTGNTDTQSITPSSSRKDVTTNYEVDRNIRHVKEDSGRVQRLSVAVVVNYQEGQDQEGKPTTAPLSDQQLAQVKRLVREAMGFSDTRGDTLEVVNSPFTDQAPIVQTPAWWQNPQLIALAKTLGQYLLIAIVAFILWRKLVKPLLERQMAGPAEQEAAAANGTSIMVGDDDEDEENDSDTLKEARRRMRRMQEERLKVTRERAKEDPRLVAMIVKGWMNESEQASE